MDDDAHRPRRSHHHGHHRSGSNHGSSSQGRHERHRGRGSRSRSPRQERRAEDREREGHRSRKRRHHHRRPERGDRVGSSGSSSDSGESLDSQRNAASADVPAPSVRWAAAAEILLGLVRSQPAVLDDLRVLLDMLDRGEGVVADGISDPIVRIGLTLLLSTLDCDEVPGPDGVAFFARRHVREAGCRLRLGPFLSAPAAAAPPTAAAVPAEPAPPRHGSESDVGAEASRASSPAAPVIGPARPPPNFDAVAAAAALAAEEEDVDDGPLPAHDPRSRRPDPRQLAAMRASGALVAAAKEEEEEEAEPSGGGPRRDRWMSMAPEGGFASLGGGRGGGAEDAGRAATKAAPRAGLGWAYLQKEEEQAPEGAAGGGEGGAATPGQPAAAPPAAPAGGPRSGAPAPPRSLAELYLQQQQQQQSAKAGPGAAGRAGGAVERRPFDRERDLAIPRTVDPGAIIARAAALHGKFKPAKR